MRSIFPESERLPYQDKQYPLLPPDNSGNISPPLSFSNDINMKIYLLATSTFKDKYSNEYIKNTFKTFIKRFFTNQFKRNCLPDGIKITPVSVSPRGDWRMASDVNYQEYIKEIDEFKI